MQFKDIEAMVVQKIRVVDSVKLQTTVADRFVTAFIQQVSTNPSVDVPNQVSFFYTYSRFYNISFQLVGTHDM